MILFLSTALLKNFLDTDTPILGFSKSGLVKNYSIFVYPRISKVEGEVIRHNNIKKINAPVIELSATEIRKMIKENKNIRPMLPPEVFEYIDKMGFYR